MACKEGSSFIIISFVEKSLLVFYMPQVNLLISASSGQHEKNLHKGELGKSTFCVRNLRLYEGRVCD